MEDVAFNLSFDEGYFEEEPRKCKCSSRVILAEHRLPCMLVNVVPPFSGEKYSVDTPQVNFILLAPRSGVDSLFPIREWPKRVCIYVPLIPSPESRDSVSAKEVMGIGTGLLYLDGKDAWRALAQ
jgi:hypothetical protein